MSIGLLLIEFFRSFHVQLIIAEILLCLRLKPRLKIYQIVLIITSYCAVPFIIDYRYFSAMYMIGDWFTFGFIIIMLISVLIIWVCFEIKTIKELLFYYIAAIVVQHMVYSVARAICLVLDIQPSTIFYAIIVASFLVIYPSYYFIFVRRLKRDNTPILRGGYIVIFTFFSAFFVYILSLWTTRTETLTVGSFLFDIFCCVLLLVLHFGMFEWSKLEKQNEIMQHLLHAEKERHAISTENIELINMKCHDLKYQIASLKNMVNTSIQRESIEELEQATKIYDTSVKTGNDTLDVLLSERSLQWDKNDISFTCIADGSKLNFMLPSDIYSLFGNALDNAIESVKKLEDPEKRVISLYVSFSGNYVIINLSNYFEHELLYDDELPATTKQQDGYHGFGLKSIKYLVEKYKGTLSIVTKDNVFKLNIIIPNSESREINTIANATS